MHETVIKEMIAGYKDYYFIGQIYERHPELFQAR